MFICWHPGYLGSETLTLTTYYPAPYGGYVNILTTGNAYLARDGGGVSIGPGGALAAGVKLDVRGGGVEMDGGTTIHSRGRMHIDGQEALYLLNRSGVIVGQEWGGNGDLTVEGQLRSVCERKSYTMDGSGVTNCSANYKVVGHVGTNMYSYDVVVYTERDGTEMTLNYAEDWGGYMICCKMNL